MTSWRAGHVDTQVAVDDKPSTVAGARGRAFLPQTPLGVRHVDNADDRVTYEASIVSDVPQAVTRLFRGNVISDGVQAAQRPGLLQNPNPTRSANVPTDGDPGNFLMNDGRGNSVAETDVRPWAGFPLQGTSDVEYAQRTNDVNGYLANTLPYPRWHSTPGERRVMEAAMDYPSTMATHPSQVQQARPWDVKLGRWPWTGDKNAMARPLTSQPLNFDQPIPNALPSASGAGGVAYMRNDLSVKPLTFRVAPAPWDQGTGGDFVDGGQ